jgi:hypothetical protein
MEIFMNRSHIPVRAALLALAVLAAACQDSGTMLTAPDDALESRSAHAPQDLRAWFARSAPEVLALPQTVFADHDEQANRLVFGIENADAMRGVQNALTRMGIPATAYEIRVTEPISFMATLRDRHRPTMGGLQIHWSNYVCTLGFSVDHAAGRSMITNSHCTNNQGSTGTTAYYQPTSSVDPSAIAIEADDPAYFTGGVCSRGKKCRYSDSSRALYADGVASQARIAKTTGLNSGSLTINGDFSITSQDNTSTSFSGTVQKVGRTTGWTSGSVTNTCATVNVSGSSIQLLCQTLVQGSGTIVGGGDSGSPVFTGSSNVTLIGILWGGSSAGDLFVFSPFKSIQDELGAMDATTDGVGGDGGGGDDGGDNGECIPRGPNGNNCK